MAEEHINPLVAAAMRKLAEADARGGWKIVHWLPDQHCWTVPSSDPDKPGYEVRRKHPPVDRTPEEYAAARARSKGQWWWILDCSCPAATAGYAVCWHKAAVFRWWQAYRRVDGEAYGDKLPFSPAAAHANSDTDNDGVERWKDRDYDDGPLSSGTCDDLPRTPVYYDVDDVGVAADAYWSDCECQPGPVNCPDKACGCLECELQQMGDLFGRQRDRL